LFERAKILENVSNRNSKRFIYVTDLWQNCYARRSGNAFRTRVIYVTDLWQLIHSRRNKTAFLYSLLYLRHMFIHFDMTRFLQYVWQHSPSEEWNYNLNIRDNSVNPGGVWLHFWNFATTCGIHYKMLSLVKHWLFQSTIYLLKMH
jgi:hypothetical protein